MVSAATANEPIAEKAQLQKWRMSTRAFEMDLILVVLRRHMADMPLKKCNIGARSLSSARSLFVVLERVVFAV